jgi:hypothetical protein
MSKEPTNLECWQTSYGLLTPNLDCHDSAASEFSLTASLWAYRIANTLCNHLLYDTPLCVVRQREFRKLGVGEAVVRTLTIGVPAVGSWMISNPRDADA